MIKSKTIELIPVENEHINQLSTWNNNLSLDRLPILSKYKLSIDDVGKTLNDLKDNFFIVMESRQAVGCCYFKNFNLYKRSAEIYCFIDNNLTNEADLELRALKLFINYIFQDIGLNKVSSDILTANVFLKRIYEKIGFKQDVRKRQHYFVEGFYHNVSEMSILASEFSYERNEN